MNSLEAKHVDTAKWATGHEPTVSFRIVKDFKRPDPELVHEFGAFFVPDISDQVGQLYTFDAGIRPLYSPMRRVIGTALTVKISPGDNSVVKRALLMAKPGDVLIVDARGHTDTCAGGAGSLIPAIKRGLQGIVVDGAWRDLAELQALDFPILGRGISPYSGPKRRPGEINVPVCCGGVIVSPGDIVIADLEGGVVVPHAYAQSVRHALKPHQPRHSIGDFDYQRATELEDERDRWFEKYFRAHGGRYE